MRICSFTLKIKTRDQRAVARELGEAPLGQSLGLFPVKIDYGVAEAGLPAEPAGAVRSNSA